MADETDTTSPQTETSVDDILVELMNEGEEEEIEIEGETEDEHDEELDIESEDDADTETEDGSEDESETEESWSGALGVDDANILVDEEGNFKGVNVKIDGESSTVDMKSLIAGYQTNKHNTNTSQSLAQDRKQFETVRSNAVADYTKKLEDVSKLTEHLSNSLLSEYNNINWQSLRESDPAEYAALNQDFERRNSEIKQIFSAIQSDSNQEKALGNQQSQVQQQEYLKGELTKVVANNPEWDTVDKVKTAFTEMSSFVNDTYGITPDVFNSLSDSRYIEVMKDAMAYRNGKKSVQTKKIVQKLPKFQKSKSGKVKKKVTKLDKLKTAANKSHGSSKRKLQDSAIAELLTG